MHCSLNKKLVRYLEVYGFMINPYDPYISNTDINGPQMTVIWNMDDLKWPHKESFEVTWLAAYLTDIYGGLKVSRGKVHNYLSMVLF